MLVRDNILVACMRACVCVCVCVCVCGCVCERSHTRTHARTHTHTHVFLVIKKKTPVQAVRGAAAIFFAKVTSIYAWAGSLDTCTSLCPARARCIVRL